MVTGGLVATVLEPEDLVEETLAIWPTALPPQPAASLLQRLPDESRFEAAFVYGEAAGSELSLSKLRERAGALPAPLEVAFLDGAAHGWSPATEDPELVAREIDQLPLQVRPFFVDGAALHFTMAHPREPERVWAYTRALSLATGFPTANGLRIGYQQARGHLLAEAIDDVTLWEPSLWGAMYEELGWRIGHEERIGELRALALWAPVAQRCALAQGAARGASLRGLAQRASMVHLLSLVAQVEVALPRCGVEARIGLVHALEQRLGPTAAEIISRSTDPLLAEAARRLHEGKETSGVLGPAGP